MKLVGELNTVHLGIILAMALAYVLFLIRMGRIGRKLQISVGVWPKLILRSLYLVFFLVALLAPSFGESKQEVKTVGKDIMLCVDLSESMNADDIQPTRLEKLKFELKRIVSSFNSDRIGLIIFSGEAYTQCPLTYDQSALFLFIESLSTDLVANTGTNFAPPLAMALEKLTNVNNELSVQRENKFKIIVLASDGEDFDPNTRAVANDIVDQGIKLFTLGIGTNEGSLIPQGRTFLRDARGVEVTSKLNSDPLKELAEISGGKYYEINENSNDIQRMIAYIANLQGSLVDSRVIDVSANKYSYFLLIGLVLLVFDISVPKKLVKI